MIELDNFIEIEVVAVAISDFIDAPMLLICINFEFAWLCAVLAKAVVP